VVFSKLKIKKPAPTKVDYVLPSIAPTGKEIKETTVGESEKKDKLPLEVTKDDAENVAMVIRTLMAQE